VNDRDSHLSLYRRWRPQRFGDVVGQAEIVRTLRNAVVAGEVAHAYLFAGERGIGKTSVARILARAVNCLQPEDGEPCNVCANCETIRANRSLDIVEIDGASNRGIDHIRRLREEVSFSPTDLKKKVYIIDEVHMLTNEAFNALLKTLEEPPAHAVFAFATTEPHKLPRTIVSRCQAFEFRKIASELIAERLRAIAESEGVSLAPGAVELIARRANGAMRDALVMLEQATTYERDEISVDTVLDMLGLADEETHRTFADAIRGKDGRAVLRIIDDLADRGKDLEVFLGDVIALVRDRIAGAGPEDCGDPIAREVALARGLLDVKAELFRALDRRVLIEIGILDVMGRLPATGRPRVTKEATSAGEPEEASSAPGSGSDLSGAMRTPAENGVADDDRLEEALADRKTPPTPVDPGLEAAWATMLEEVGRERIAVAAFLTECRPSLTDGKLVLYFHPAHTFHKESLEKRANLQYLAGVVRRHFGDGVFVDVQYDPSVERKPTARELLHEKAELICRVFDGKIVKEET